jgi:hypothetical protein
MRDENKHTYHDVNGKITRTEPFDYNSHIDYLTTLIDQER